MAIKLHLLCVNDYDLVQNSAREWRDALFDFKRGSGSGVKSPYEGVEQTAWAAFPIQREEEMLGMLRAFETWYGVGRACMDTCIFRYLHESICRARVHGYMHI